MDVFFTCFAALLIAHCVCDYPLQGDFLAKAKNHKAPIPGVPWGMALFSHCAIHAGAVWAVTQSATIASLEFFAHAATDYLKCGGSIDFATDQLLHVFHKAVWSLWLVAFGGTFWLAPGVQ